MWLCSCASMLLFAIMHFINNIHSSPLCPPLWQLVHDEWRRWQLISSFCAKEESNDVHHTPLLENAAEPLKPLWLSISIHSHANLLLIQSHELPKLVLKNHIHKRTTEASVNNKYFNRNDHSDVFLWINIIIGYCVSSCQGQGFFWDLSRYISEHIHILRAAQSDIQ